MCTHDHIMVRQYGERVVKLEDGQVVADVERYRPKVSREAKAIADKAYRPLEEGLPRRRPASWEAGILEVGREEDR
jgi:energy-coupling factor transporter ATP-binding protein EcfA2